TASAADSHSCSSAARRPAPPLSAGEKVGGGGGGREGGTRAWPRASPAVGGGGGFSMRCAEGSGGAAGRISSGPLVVSTDITSSSRMGSIGGLVTCAKSCLK